MKIGIDYWQVISHYPAYFRQLADMHLKRGDQVYVITALGKARAGGRVRNTIVDLKIPFTAVYEVIFDNPSQSPELKLAKCKELGITVFYDDRDDVCRLLNKNGILSMRVTRKDNSTYDLEAEQK